MGEQGQEVPITTTPPPGPVAPVNDATTPHRFYVHHEPKKIYNIYIFQVRWRDSHGRRGLARSGRVVGSRKGGSSS